MRSSRPKHDGSELERLAGLGPEAVRVRARELFLRDGESFLDRLAQHLSEKAAALDLAHGFGDALSVGALLPRLAARLGTFLEAEQARVWIPADGTEELVSFEVQGNRLQERRVSRAQGLAGQVLEGSESLLIPDVRLDPRFEGAVEAPPNCNATSVLFVPLMSQQGEAQGVLEAWGPPAGFGPRDIARLGHLPIEAGTVIEKTRLVEDLVKNSGYNATVLDALGSAVVTIDTEGLIAKANVYARRLFRAEELPGMPAADFFTGANAWVAEMGLAVAAGGPASNSLGTELQLSVGGPLPPGRVERRRSTATVNLTASPLRAANGTLMGALLVIEDVTREKRLRGTLARYMTQAVADRLIEEGEGALGGRLQKATVLFSDIRDFTQLSERLGPQETVKLLNECFTLMVDVILKHHGTLDKYLGDGLMAVFGAPYPSGDDAADALRAAIGMLQALRDFNRRRATATLPRLQMGFGLNTAEVVSGNIGSLKRMDYTVIGDGVNLASRLEGANREYGTQLLVSEFTLADLTGSYLLREVDRLRVRGRQQPVAVFEVLDYSAPEIMPHLRYVVSLYNEGLDRYRQRQWEAGVKMFEEALQLKPDDGPAQLYRRRCEHFLKSPPPENWDGVWVLTSK